MSALKSCVIGGRMYHIGDVVLDLKGERAPRVVIQSADPGPTQWFVVQTNPNCERRAEGGLREAGLDVYLPRLSRWQAIPERQRQPRGPNRREVVAPLFPGYLFVGSRRAVGPDWMSVSKTDGVRRVLGVQGGKEAVPADAFDHVRNIEVEADRQFRRAIRNATLLAGDTVQIQDGPFAQFVAEVVAMSDADRVKVLVNIFGRSTPIELSVDAVEKVG